MNKSKNKIITIMAMNIILIVVFYIIQYNPILADLYALRRPYFIHNFINFLTYAFIHVSLYHLFNNLLFFNFFGFATLLNNDDWYHLVGVSITSMIIGGLGYIYLSPRGLVPVIGFSAAVFGMMMYSMLSCRKSVLVQIALLIICFLMISENYIMLYMFNHSIGVDAHIWGALGALIYRIAQGMFKHTINNLNSIFYIKD